MRGFSSRTARHQLRNTYFKHALVQDAAYGTLLRETRRTVHFRIAHALESRFPDTVARQPELLARLLPKQDKSKRQPLCGDERDSSR
jgi:predicted ATPase